MYKILIIDRCYFSRLGLETWLQQTAEMPPCFITSLNGLWLAKAHIERWQPHLVIADLSHFLSDPQQSAFIPPFLALCEQRSRLMLLQAVSLPPPVTGIFSLNSKRLSLQALGKTTRSALRGGAVTTPCLTVSALLTRQEEKVIALWMEGASNQGIAREMNINDKTVYTHKRNIRRKLRMDNRYSPFLPAPVSLGE